MIGSQSVLMMRHFVHILLVFAVSLAVVLAGVLSGNVLCMGNDGHVAIEPPHQVSVAPRPTVPSLAGQQVPVKEHGSCNDITVDVEVVVRQTAMGTLDAPTIVPPVLDVALPDVLAAVVVPAGAVNPSDAVQVGTTLDRLRCVILLI